MRHILVGLLVACAVSAAPIRDQEYFACPDSEYVSGAEQCAIIVTYYTDETVHARMLICPLGMEPEDVCSTEQLDYQPAEASRWTTR